MITDQDAIEVAREMADQAGWTWIEPVQVTWHATWFPGSGKWEVWSNAAGLGAKVRVIVDSRSGAVISTGFIAQ